MFGSFLFSNTVFQQIFNHTVLKIVKHTGYSMLTSGITMTLAHIINSIIKLGSDA